MMKWIALAVGGMVLGAVAAVMFVNVTAPQMTVGTEPMPAENAITMDRGGGLVRNEVTDRIEDRTREKFRADLSGRARVIDGDTLEVGGARMRLYGIDTPESAQSCLARGRRWSCGREATRALSGRIGSRTVTCEERDRDRYGRIVAVCRVGGRGRERLDGRAGLGLRLPQVLDELRRGRSGGEDSQARNLAR